MNYNRAQKRLKGLIKVELEQMLDGDKVLYYQLKELDKCLKKINDQIEEASESDYVIGKKLGIIYNEKGEVIN